MDMQLHTIALKVAASAAILLLFAFVAEFQTDTLTAACGAAIIAALAATVVLLCWGL